jgi:hypothetical protein
MGFEQSVASWIPLHGLRFLDMIMGKSFFEKSLPEIL